MLFLLFSFRGRINRAQYWFGTLLVSFGSLVSQIMISMLAAGGAAKAKSLSDQIGAYSGAAALVLPVTGVVLWCSLAVQVKRLHDRGRPGWISAVPFGVTLMLIGTVISDVLSRAPLEAIVNNALLYFWILVLCGLAMFIDLGCLPSQEGSNKYGDPPGTPGARGPQPQPIPGMPSTKAFVSVQEAMDRAIAQREAQPEAARNPSASAPRPAMAGAQAAPAGGARGFGRRPTR
jgi:uncharacterized membrane protein YhaH (DUF805 family)